MAKTYNIIAVRIESSLYNVLSVIKDVQGDKSVSALIKSLITAKIESFEADHATDSKTMARVMSAKYPPENTY